MLEQLGCVIGLAYILIQVFILSLNIHVLVTMLWLGH